MIRQKHTAANTTSLDLRAVQQSIRVGDVVFIRSRALPFRKVAEATNSWTNHVGIVTDISGSVPLVAESTFPFSKATPLPRFVACSEQQRIAIKRLRTPLTDAQKQAIRDAATKKFNIFYDTGFNLLSRRQFCSCFVHEALFEATQQTIGEVEDFRTLLARNPETGLAFWRVWYFGRIPWSRKTVTPASLLESPDLQPVMEGYVRKERISLKPVNLLCS